MANCFFIKLPLFRLSRHCAPPLKMFRGIIFLLLQIYSIYILKIYTIKEMPMKTAKIFQNGPSQAVRLPKEFRFAGSEVFIKKNGNIVLLIPRSDSWNSLFGSLKKFSSDFLVERIQPELDKRENFL